MPEAELGLPVEPPIDAGRAPSKVVQAVSPSHARMHSEQVLAAGGKARHSGGRAAALRASLIVSSTVGGNARDSGGPVAI